VRVTVRFTGMVQVLTNVYEKEVELAGSVSTLGDLLGTISADYGKEIADRLRQGHIAMIEGPTGSRNVRLAHDSASQTALCDESIVSFLRPFAGG